MMGCGKLIPHAIVITEERDRASQRANLREWLVALRVPHSRVADLRGLMPFLKIDPGPRSGQTGNYQRGLSLVDK